MAPLPSRSAAWIPVAVQLGAAVLTSLVLGWAIGARALWVYVGLMVAVILGIGYAERFWTRRKAPRPPRARGRLKIIPGGKAGYDLEKDDPEHRQRWLM